MKHLLPALTALLLLTTLLHAQTPGCTDPLANNFNASATVNDGSCLYNAATVAPVNDWLLSAVLNETSGLVIWNDRIWTHNDDTDTNLYALDTLAINAPASHAVSGTANVDWEEIAQDSLYLYIGDFGNNVNGNRTDLHILRVDKASLLLQSPVVDTIAFGYATQTDFTPTGNNNTDYDCEAFVVAGDSIYLFTKQWVSEGMAIYALPKVPGTYSASLVASLNVQGLVTGATYLADKRLVLLAGYSSVLQPFLYLLYDFQGQDFLGGNKRKVSLNLPFHQVEGIATVDGLHCLVSNERFQQSVILTEAKLHALNLHAFLGDYLDTNSVDVVQVASTDAWEVSPNPGSETMRFRRKVQDAGAATLVIHNTAGQLVGRYALPSDALLLPVGDWARGVYHFRIEGAVATSGRFVLR